MTFSFLLVPTPNFQNLEKSAFSCDLKDEKEAKTYYICFVPQARNSKRLPTFASNQFIYCFLEKRRKKSTADQIVLLIQKSRILSGLPSHKIFLIYPRPYSYYLCIIFGLAELGLNIDKLRVLSSMFSSIIQYLAYLRKQVFGQVKIYL